MHDPRPSFSTVPLILFGVVLTVTAMFFPALAIAVVAVSVLSLLGNVLVELREVRRHLDHASWARTIDAEAQQVK